MARPMDKKAATDLPAFLDATPDAIIAADDKGRITMWNSAAAKIFGYSATEAKGMSLEKLVPEKYRAQHRAGFKRFLETKKASLIGKTVEVEGLRKDNSLLPVELSLSAKQSGQGWAFMAILRDITERKGQEEKRRSGQTKLSRMNSDLLVLYKVSRALGSTLNREALFLKVLKMITEIKLFNIEKKGGIFLVDGNRMELVTHLGHSGEFLNIHKNIKVGDCLCGLSAKTGEVLVSGNSSEDDRHTIRYPDIVPHGHIIVPLKAKGAVVGVMYLYTAPDSTVDKNTKELLHAVGNQLGIAISNLSLYEKTKTLTLKDPLTRLANRRYLNIEIKRSVSLAHRTGSTISVIMIDIDRFKTYNDTYGHMAGDMLLKNIADVFKQTLRDTDLVARYGGEEFLALLPETGLMGAKNVAERIRKNVKARTGVTVSLGVAELSKKSKGWKGLVQRADKALYRAKNNGRNRVEGSVIRGQ